MTEYAISTNLISYAPAKAGIFGSPQGGPEAEVVQGMAVGDWLIPKFAQLIVDELNRADIDKAFGPLFTLLAGTDAKHPSDSVVLPFQGKDGKNSEIAWAENRNNGVSPYLLTPGWRLIGTLNVSEKASLFQLSFAFLRRFAIIDVPLPPEATYSDLFASRCAELDDSVRPLIVEAAMKLARYESLKTRLIGAKSKASKAFGVTPNARGLS